MAALDLQQIDTTAVSLARQAELRAASYYEQGYHCGEAVLKAVNELAGHPMPPEVFRMGSGFCEGLGGSRCICGALASGVMALGMLGGRGSSTHPWEPTYYASGELNGRWMEQENASSCAEVAERFGGMQHPVRWAHCAELCGSCARWVVEIAEDNGWL
ncbi:MAG TPA: C-GCAxxG-C-C family protein [Coriobacteriia bacterium]|nr:C-GCAxxG-C-C family protein [Coriobacteriia bacterium]